MVDPPKHDTVYSMRLADPASIPDTPGCYQFYEGEICLYVGKARNLRQRLATYLQPHGVDDARIAGMVRRADRLEWTVLTSETEALLVEANLIAALDPVYNIRLRADHPYPSVAFDGRHGVVRVHTWRGPSVPGVITYGPYPGRASRAIIGAIVDLHQLATCNLGKFRLHQRIGRPCLLGDIGTCSAPCVQRISDASYAQSVADAQALVGGRVGNLRRQYREEMETAAAAYRYEQAGAARDRLAAVEQIASVQVIDAAGGIDADVVAAYVDDVGGAACTVSIRSGALVSIDYVIVDAGVATVTDLEHSAVVALLGATTTQRAPAALLLSEGACSDDVRALHRQCAGGRARIRGPRSAGERALVALARDNAVAALARSRMRRASDRDGRRASLARLADALELQRAPLRIESVDISHLGGAATVSVIAVLVDGLPVRRQYRRYRLRDHGGDDYAAMREVLTRRIADGIDGIAPLPDLLVIDGGAGQLGVAVEVLHELGVAERVEVVAIAKRLESLLRPQSSTPILLEPGDDALLLLQRARDETHHASNQFQRRVAARALRRDWLDGIDGIGPKRKQRLLAAFGGWRGLTAASDADIRACSFLPEHVREAVVTVRAQRNGTPTGGDSE